jgi:hypothetical protein
MLVYLMVISMAQNEKWNVGGFDPWGHRVWHAGTKSPTLDSICQYYPIFLTHFWLRPVCLFPHMHQDSCRQQHQGCRFLWPNSTSPPSGNPISWHLNEGLLTFQCRRKGCSNNFGHLKRSTKKTPRPFRDCPSKLLVFVERFFIQLIYIIL